MSEQWPQVLIAAEDIQKRVQQLADEISTDFHQANELVVIGVLRGCYIFMADLTRLLTIPRAIDFIAVSSYGDATTPGPVRLVMDTRKDIAGQHVLLVDDIIDTGHTLQYLTQLLEARRPASLKTCVLVRKAVQTPYPKEIDYLGFDIADQWVVGYGLDANDRFRALPYIGVYP